MYAVWDEEHLYGRTSIAKYDNSSYQCCSWTITYVSDFDKGMHVAKLIRLQFVKANINIYICVQNYNITR